MKKIESYIRFRVEEIIAFNLSKANECDWDELSSILIRIAKYKKVEEAINYKYSILFDYLFLKYHSDKLNVRELKYVIESLGFISVSDCFPCALAQVDEILDEDKLLKEYLNEAKKEKNVSFR